MNTTSQLHPLEANLLMPNGGTAARCQARKHDGTQCGKAARKDFSVCASHGAGTAKRVAEGTRRRPGRPPIHGLYAKSSLTSIQDLMEEVHKLQGELDNSDQELALLKATLWFLLGQADAFNAKVAQLEALLERLTADSSDLTMDESDVRAIGKDLAQGQRLISSINAWTQHLGDFASKIILASKTRAETRAKLAESKALEHFVTLAEKVRDVVMELSPDMEFIDLFEMRMKQEIYGPNYLELPERTEPS